MSQHIKYRTVAICEEHWRDEEGDREPVRMQLPTPRSERCYRCNVVLTNHIIYVRRRFWEDD